MKKLSLFVLPLVAAFASCSVTNNSNVDVFTRVRNVKLSQSEKNGAESTWMQHFVMQSTIVLQKVPQALYKGEWIDDTPTWSQTYVTQTTVYKPSLSGPNVMASHYVCVGSTWSESGAKKQYEIKKDSAGQYSITLGTELFGTYCLEAEVLHKRLSDAVLCWNSSLFAGAMHYLSAPDPETVFPTEGLIELTKGYGVIGKDKLNFSIMGGDTLLGYELGNSIYNLNNFKMVYRSGTLRSAIYGMSRSTLTSATTRDADKYIISSTVVYPK